MRWSERQRAMLAGMGVRLWEREAAAGGVEPAAGPAWEQAPVRAPMRAPAPAPEPAPVQAQAPLDLPAADWLVVAAPFGAVDPRNAQLQLLDNMLRAIGVARDAPGRAGRAAFLAVADKAAPSAGAHADDGAHRARVQAAIDSVRPKCIVALGRGAAHALFASDEPLGALRGRVHVAFGVPVIVTCSLAFLLRHGAEKERAWADLCRAVGVADAVAA